MIQTLEGGWWVWRSLYSELKILIHRLTAILNKKDNKDSKAAAYLQIG